MLVKPMNANDLLRQIEALLIQHEDSKHKADVKVPARAASAAEELRDKPRQTPQLTTTLPSENEQAGILHPVDGIC